MDRSLIEASISCISFVLVEIKRTAMEVALQLPDLVGDGWMSKEGPETLQENLQEYAPHAEETPLSTKGDQFSKIDPEWKSQQSLQRSSLRRLD